jgi:hypothetical protein
VELWRARARKLPLHDPTKIERGLCDLSITGSIINSLSSWLRPRCIHMFAGSWRNLATPSFPPNNPTPHHDLYIRNGETSSSTGITKTPSPTGHFLPQRHRFMLAFAILAASLCGRPSNLSPFSLRRSFSTFCFLFSCAFLSFFRSLAAM